MPDTTNRLPHGIKTLANVRRSLTTYVESPKRTVDITTRERLELSELYIDILRLENKMRRLRGIDIVTTLPPWAIHSLTRGLRT